jgi:hypothetical protein
MYSSFLGWGVDVGIATVWRTKFVVSVCYKFSQAVLASVGLLEHAATWVLSGHKNFSIIELDK